MTFGAVIDVLAAIGAGTCLYFAIMGLRRLLPDLPHRAVRKNGRRSTGCAGEGGRRRASG